MQLNGEELKRAYRMMFSIRAFEERVEKEFAAGNIPGFCHVYLGQEASAAGVCFDLTDQDWIGSTHRGHGHCIAKGCDLRGMMLEIMGKEGGLCGGKGGSMHIADMSKGMLGANAIVGGSPPIAVGAALTQKVRGSGKVAVAFSGDGASNQGTTFEALNMAVVLGAPAIFVFENNGYGEFTSADYSVGAASITERAKAFGLPAECVDGSDFFEVREAMGRALERTRAGAGPYALEVKCSRFRGHFVGDPQAYRSKEELSEAQLNDPLIKFRQRVSDRRLLSADDFASIQTDVLNQIEAAVHDALAASPPPPEALMRDVYARY